MGSFILDEHLPPVVMRGADGEALQGWCSDPTQRHEERYISQGAPTKLYRDGGAVDKRAEGYDDIWAYLASMMDANTDESREAAPSGLSTPARMASSWPLPP